MFYNKSSSTGITKFINYSNSSPQRAEKFSRYLQNLSKTNSAYVATNYLDRNNIEQSIKVLERKWKPGGSRSFKQGILAYGLPVGEYPVEEIMKFNKELLKKIFPDFPWMFTVHTNKNLLHSHFLLVTTNVLTGKKLSQSPKDLQSFKDCYDDLAVKYGLPTLKRSNPALPVPSLVSKIANNIDSGYVIEHETVTSTPVRYFDNSIDYCPTNSGLQSNAICQQTINTFLAPIAFQIQQNIAYWYELGKKRRNLSCQRKML